MLGLVVAVATLIPNLAMANDQAIASHIMSRLQLEQQRGALKGFHVDMRVDQGTVWYQGFVSEQAQKDLILRTAQEAKHLGVVQIVDDITVRVVAGSNTEMVDADQPETETQNSVPEAVQPEVNNQPVAVEEFEVETGNQPLAQTAYQETAPMPQTEMAETSSRIQRVPAQRASTGPIQIPEAAQGQTGIVNNGQPLPISQSAAVTMPASGDAASLPSYAWPTYAAHPNYGAVTYPGQYSASAWPYIGPFYPYPQVPLGWRKVTLEWDDGWWWLDFHNR
jgi:hypothetical protein